MALPVKEGTILRAFRGIPISITESSVKIRDPTDKFDRTFYFTTYPIDFFDTPYNKSAIIDILNDARSTESQLLFFVDFGGCILVGVRSVTETPPKWQVVEQHLDILVQTNDKTKAIRIMKEAHRRRPFQYHELEEFWDGRYNGVQQYAPGDPSNQW